ncbi:dolichyl-P-Man:Man(7)GlcNAc(2)-PP-dolichyl-alpha-1,6-mannosyltransferase [Thraustotheca clavata]|uniref:Mannosyltransferase n=1 Tax=Thraustotheca clavata TaxID=74557 RepID=A0A1W0A563_9STRA|nr:dolichyl-P-Man:Man(7)GlcNAc(2)-PP-dolichyl-alpha-1,6-mannosyltransferase [Thraustotheca clavata]
MRTMDEVLVLAMGLFHLWLSPYAKVEESFNLQAMHDLIYVRNLTAFDHFEFPGVVPRTFLGTLPVALLALPLSYVLSKASMQIVARAMLWLLVFFAWRVLKRTIGTVYGHYTAKAFSTLTAVQFHWIFYMSRTLPNIFALALVMLAYAAWMQNRPRIVIFLLSFSTIVFRGDTAVLFAPILLTMLLARQVGFFETIWVGLSSAVFALVLTVLVDSFFWQRWLWPEGEVLWFNTILNKSHEWGIQPFLWYFFSALPRSLGATAALIPLGLTSLGTLLPNVMNFTLIRSNLTWRTFFDRDVCFYTLPIIFYVVLFSNLPHKELRFVLNAVPMLNFASAMGISKLWRNRTKAIWPLILVAGAIFVSALMTLVFTLASHANYPGGVAFEKLHQIGQNRALEPVSVHIDVAAAMTGVSRFGEQHPSWTYSKAEDLTDFSSFDYLLAELPLVKGFQPVATIEAFDRIDIRSFRIKYRPAIYVHERRLDEN